MFASKGFSPRRHRGHRELCALRVSVVKSFYGMRREPPPVVAETESPHLFPRAQARHRIFGGLNERQEHIFTWIAVVVVLLYVTGWIGAIHTAYEDQREVEREAKEAGVKVPPPPAPPPIATQIFQ